MLWLDKNKRIWRTAILIMLLVALIGPWTFERINVPAKYPCTSPFIRLEGDFCGEPMSGIWILSLMIFGMVSSSMGLASGGSFSSTGLANSFLAHFYSCSSYLFSPRFS